MADIRTYTLIYIALVALATGKFVFFHVEAIGYDMALAGTLILAVIKVGLIAGYFQHLKEEPRSISYMMATAVFMVFLLTIAAGYSIQ
ncbi:cytochrome C oxidase subunit IV family protein [Haloterrigena sp. SYSU A558-1]|uniref:Cytochrome C oxidase subunit IV family protein n=1 Tax=Haloterrigena gelatinilytica TaxID=2741724 RepID=A0A8J8GMQ3_9EURY|nr:cytochrome C oxidase subunit IV family protein [Haloterrigena gelatinilytica]NUB92521.1 cytochrome C oxidase subunit IV family protein [Haloterrigena gelatinilytica]NUC71562.1 cytochrome C oxidase subunit IV family protein [Haloterrigena gelatinilytica]